MPIKTKDKLLQIRIEQELLERFSRLCDAKGWTVSAAVRWSIQDSVERYERRIASDAQWTVTKESRAVAARAAEAVEKPAVEAPVQPERPLARKRRLEKEAKASNKAKREDRY